MNEFLDYISSPKFMISVLVVVGAFLLWFLIKKIVSRYSKKNKKYSIEDGKTSTAMRVAFNIIRYFIILFTVLLVLQVNDINVTSLIAGLGIASAIVGLALQDILKDVIMGIHIMSGKFFSTGDVVKYGDVEGVVISFNLTTTRIKNTRDLSILSVCNRNISEVSKVSEYNEIDVPISYNEDVKKVHTVLSEICEKINAMNGITSCVYKGTQSFNDSAVIYRITLFCPPQRKYDLRRAAIMKIQDGLGEAGIKIPYNQLDVHHYMNKE